MSSNNKSREHFLHLSRKIIRPETPAKVASLPNFTSKNPTPSIFSLNIGKTDRTDRTDRNKTRQKPASTHLRLSSGASQLKSARTLLKPNPLQSPAEKSADRFLTSRSQNTRKERNVCSIADNLSSAILPTFSSLEEDSLERPTPHPDAVGETFMITDDGILNVNPQSVVAKYINKCFKSPDVLRNRKNNRTPIDFHQRMGDLTSTHHPEYIKNHGTMLSCELWGTRRRVEYRHRLEAIENKDRSFKERKLKRNPSIHDALTEINQTNNQTPSINDMILDSKISTQSTFGTLNLESKSQSKGKSLAELRRARVKACLNDIVKASPIPPELDLEADITMENLIKEVEFPKKSSNLISPKTKAFERKNTKALFNKLRMMKQSATTPKLI